MLWIVVVICSFNCAESDTSDELSGSSSTKREAQVGGLKLDLPLDDDDYLMPSPQQGQSVTTTATSAAYMDLISDAKQNGEWITVIRYPIPVLAGKG